MKEKSRLNLTQTFVTYLTVLAVTFIPVKNLKKKSVFMVSSDNAIESMYNDKQYFTALNDNADTSIKKETIILGDDEVYHTEYLPDMNGGLIKFETEEEKRNKYFKGKTPKPKQMCKVRQDKYQFYS